MIGKDVLEGKLRTMNKGIEHEMELFPHPFPEPCSDDLLALIGLILFFPVLIADWTGLFSSRQAPPSIVYLEIATAIVVIGVLFLATRVYRESAVKKPDDA